MAFRPIRPDWLPRDPVTLAAMAPPALWLYRILLSVSLGVAAPWLLLEDQRRRLERPPLRHRLGRGLPPLPPGGLWVQAVSVGEVAVARPVLLEVRRRHPELPLILSSTTATGLALASGQLTADVVLPFPVDLPGPVRRCLDAARPRVVVLVETELWPELLAGCQKRGVPVVLVNARISDSSFKGYRAARWALAPLLRPVALVLAQGEEEGRRLAALGIAPERIRVVGNIKFDAAPAKPAPTELLAELRRLAGSRPIWAPSGAPPSPRRRTPATWSSSTPSASSPRSTSSPPWRSSAAPSSPAAATTRSNPPVSACRS